MQLLIVRHAEPAYPRDALTDRGRWQARLLAEHLARSGIEALHSSPMERAMATARAVAEVAAVEVGVEPWTAELETWAIRPGRVDESPAWEVDACFVRGAAAAADRQRWPVLEPLASADLAAPFAELVRASDRFLAGLGYRREGEAYRGLPGAARGRQVMICHCGLALTWLAHLLAMPPTLIWAGFTLAPASVTTVVFEPAGSGLWVPRCRSLGEVAHLAGAAEPE